MLRRLFDGPWPEAQAILPEAIQQQASTEIRKYWLTRGWPLVLGEVVIWAIVLYEEVANPRAYGILAGLIVVGYLLGLMPSFNLVWLVGSMGFFLAQGMLINGVGAVTALSFIVQYTIAGMLLSGRHRVFVQACCILAFWASLIYEAFPVFDQLTPTLNIQVSYNVLLAVYTFQTLRFLNQLAVDLNKAYVADEVQKRSQEFLAKVSHELRTPLHVALGRAKLMLFTDLSAKQAGHLNHVIEQGEHLNRLVGDLLDSAHLATGRVTLNLEPINLNELCRTVIEESRPSVPSEINLEVDCEAHLPTIEADKVRLRQAVSNLVGNAIKYTEAGCISLRTYTKDSSVFIEVQDTGKGISEEEQALIFIPFVQLDTRTMGVGLGLDIARQLVRLHGGEMHLQSKLGEGSTFTIELPMQRQNRDNSAATPARMKT